MVNLPNIPNPFKSDEDGSQQDSKHSGPSQHPKPAPVPKEAGTAFATILSTPESRSAFVDLINSIIRRMRDGITAPFDPRYVGTTPPSPPKFSPEKTHRVEKEKSSNSPEFKADADMDEEKKSKHLEKVTKELSDPEVQKLKTKVLESFENWRDVVVHRLKEALEQKSASKEEEEHEAEKLDEKKEESSSPKADEAEKIANEMLKLLYPPIETALTTQLDESQRRGLLSTFLLLLLSLSQYPSHSRILLLQLAITLQLPLSTLTMLECSLAQTLAGSTAGISTDEHTSARASSTATLRAWKVGLATTAGAVLLGVTGGLAAPLVAAGVGTLFQGVGLGATAAAGYIAALAGNSVVVGGLFGAYGGRSTGKMMDEYAKAVEDFALLPVHGPGGEEVEKPENEGEKKEKKRHILHSDKHDDNEHSAKHHRLRLTIGISGWLTTPHDIIHPWRSLSPESSEPLALRFETASLLRLGNALTSLLQSTAWAVAKKEIAQRTAASLLSEALWPLGLLKFAHVLDNPFSVASARADKAGVVLADALSAKAHGARPVVLTGYSLGARVIRACLLELAKKGELGLVESAVVMGAPMAGGSADDWRRMKSAVAGRLVNVYSRRDSLLAFVYRGTAVEMGAVAGLNGVKAAGVAGVEDVDASEIVGGHLEWGGCAGRVLEGIGIGGVESKIVREEEWEKKMLEESEGDGKVEDVDDMEKDVERKNKESYAQWAKGKLKLGSVASLWKGGKDDKAERPKSKQENTPAEQVKFGKN